MCLYSYALHVRRGTYSQLPKSSYNTIPSSKFVTPGSSPSGSRRHVRNSSTGGPSYSHLRGNSIASTAGGFDMGGGIEGTLAETLWEDRENDLESRGDRSSSLGLTPGGLQTPGTSSTKSPRPSNLPALSPALSNSSTLPTEPPSPAFAKGTGMNRSNSTTGGTLTLSSNGAAGEGASERHEGGGRLRSGSGAENPFASILGRMSGEHTR